MTYHLPAFRGIVAAKEPGPITAPVLTRTSSASYNPMSWSGYYEDVLVGQDYIACRWRVNGGAWTNETNRLFTSDDYLDSHDGTASFSWPLFDVYDFPGNSLVEVQEGIVRGVDTAWSNIISDTMVTVVASIHRHSEILNFGFSSTPRSFSSAVPIDDGDKVLFLFAANFNSAAQTISSVSVNSGAISLTLAGQYQNGSRRLFIYYADTSGVTSLNVTVNVTGSTQMIVSHVISVKNAATGAPTDTYFSHFAVTNEVNHDVDGGLITPINGQLIAMSAFSTAPYIWTGATEFPNGEVDNGTMGSAVAYQTVPENITLAGQAGGGISYTTIYVANSLWSTE